MSGPSYHKCTPSSLQMVPHRTRPMALVRVARVVRFGATAQRTICRKIRSASSRLFGRLAAHAASSEVHVTTFGLRPAADMSATTSSAPSTPPARA